MSGDLVEAVARQFAFDLGYTWGSTALDRDALRDAARAVVSLIRHATLEEAAKVCDALASDPRMYSSERRRGTGQCAAAIRALKDKA